MELSPQGAVEEVHRDIEWVLPALPQVEGTGLNRKGVRFPVGNNRCSH